MKSKSGRNRGWSFFFGLSVSLFLLAVIAFVYSFAFSPLAQHLMPLSITTMLVALAGTSFISITVTTFAAFLKWAYGYSPDLAKILDGLIGQKVLSD